jgi:hypothetical protein
MVLDASGAQVGEELAIEPSLELGALAPMGTGWAEMSVEEPADFDSRTRPCADDEWSTCADVPDHYTVSFRTMSITP